MKTCANPVCGAVLLLPLGRATLSMVDGGINEVVALVCESCRTISLELAAVQTSEIPPMERPEEEKTKNSRALDGLGVGPLDQAAEEDEELDE